ncbi:MAG TPA: IPExxxVDY family protein [Chitinophagaceae bacterium]|nr:IPExxxVDY family protein [Chitinophagaceae bacterium]
MSAGKFTLDITELTEDFFSDIRLLGLQSTAKSYRFCWLLNNTMGYNFRLNSDIEAHVQKKRRHYFFPVYQHTETGSTLHHYIYCNQYDGEYLLPEFKHLDFLWLMKGDTITDEQCRQLMQTLRSMNGVQLVMEITSDQIKNKGNLIF